MYQIVLKRCWRKRKQIHSLFRQRCVTTTVVRLKKTIGLHIKTDRLDVFDYERSEYGRKAVIAASVQQPPRKIVKVVSSICLHEERIGEHEFLCWII